MATSITNQEHQIPVAAFAAVSASVAVQKGVARYYLNSIAVTNRNIAVRYLQIFNGITTPAGIPLFSFQVPLSGSLVLGSDFFGLGGLMLLTGSGAQFCVGLSTTNATYTAATPTDHDINFMYSQ